MRWPSAATKLDSCSIDLAPWCRFQPEDIVVLHDAQPHSDYWPTKVNYILLCLLTRLLSSLADVLVACCLQVQLPDRASRHSHAACRLPHHCRRTSRRPCSGSSGIQEHRTASSSPSRAMDAWTCRTTRSGTAYSPLTMRGYLPPFPPPQGSSLVSCGRACFTCKYQHMKML